MKIEGRFVLFLLFALFALFVFFVLKSVFREYEFPVNGKDHSGGVELEIAVEWPSCQGRKKKK